MLLMNMIKETKMKKIFFKKKTRRWKILQMDIIEKIKIKIKIILKKEKDMKYCRYDKRNKGKIISKKRKERNKGKNIIK